MTTCNLQIEYPDKSCVLDQDEEFFHVVTDDGQGNASRYMNMIVFTISPVCMKKLSITGYNAILPR